MWKQNYLCRTKLTCTDHDGGMNYGMSVVEMVMIRNAAIDTANSY